MRRCTFGTAPHFDEMYIFFAKISIDKHISYVYNMNIKVKLESLCDGNRVSQGSIQSAE